MDSKITLLSSIRDNKDVLFGKFSETLTKKDKEDKWNEMNLTAVALGIVPSDKPWTYLRDTTWQNWRKRTMVKKDQKGKTGRAGGKSIQYDSADMIILEIIGLDSPIMEGFSVAESSGTGCDEAFLPPASTYNSSDTENTELPSGPTQSSNSSRFISRKRRRVEKQNDAFLNEPGRELRDKKLEEQILSIQLDNRKKVLDLYEMEIRIGLPHSNLIKEFILKHYPDHSDANLN